MSLDNNGNYTRPGGPMEWQNDRDQGINILASRHDADGEDMAAAISAMLPADGRKPMGGALKMGGNKITNAAAATQASDVPTAKQTQTNVFNAADDQSGTENEIIISLTPALTEQPSSLLLTVKAAHTNTAAVTIKVNGLEEKKVLLGTADLYEGTIVAGQVYFLFYNKTLDAYQLVLSGSNTGGGQFPLLSMALFDAVLTGENAAGWELQGVKCYRKKYWDAYDMLAAEYTAAVQASETIAGTQFVYKLNASTRRRFYTQTDYDARFTLCGDSGGYVVDTDGEHFTLPKSKNFFRATDTITLANRFYLDQIQNFTGSGITVKPNYEYAPQEGVVYDHGGAEVGAYSAGVNYGRNLGIDASRTVRTGIAGSNEDTGSGMDETMPKHKLLLLYYRVGGVYSEAMSQSALTALSSAQNASASAAAAESAAISASGSAAAAASSDTNAQEKAEEAEASAQNAEASKNDASTANALAQTAAQQAQEAWQGINSIANTKIDKAVTGALSTLLQGVSVDNASTENVVLLGSNIDVGEAKAPVITQTALPMAAEDRAGIMPSAAYRQLQANTEAIAGMSGKVNVYAVHLATETPTQQQLTDAYNTASGGAALTGGAALFDLDYKKGYEYYKNISAWDDMLPVTLNTASQELLGIVQGEDVAGKIFVEGDGTMSLVGYDALVAADANLQANKVDKIAGKGLSTNDYTDAEKTKLASTLLASGTNAAMPDFIRNIGLAVHKVMPAETNPDTLVVPGIYTFYTTNPSALGLGPGTTPDNVHIIVLGNSQPGASASNPIQLLALQNTGRNALQTRVKTGSGWQPWVRVGGYTPYYSVQSTRNAGSAETPNTETTAGWLYALKSGGSGSQSNVYIKMPGEANFAPPVGYTFTTAVSQMIVLPAGCSWYAVGWTSFVFIPMM